MNIVSFSLYGTDEMYQLGAIKNAETIPVSLPGWICRFYVSSEVSESTITKLKELGAQIVHRERHNLVDGTFWRFEAIDDKDADAVIFRDTDSRISKREAQSIIQWLKSDKKVHIIRDHPYHSSLILAGMWGVKKDTLPPMHKLIDIWKMSRKLRLKGTGDVKGNDQVFLNEMIYHKVVKSAMIHTDTIKYEGEEITDFPCDRENCEFIGQVVYADNSIDEGDVDLIRNSSLKTLPLPKEHFIYKLIRLFI